MSTASSRSDSRELLEGCRIEIQRDRERVVIAPHGELDIATSPSVAEEIDGLVTSGFRAIVIDLRRTTFIDSTVVHLLLCQTARQDASITVIDGPETVSRVFDLAGVRDVLGLQPTR